jgi:hypothetical protein
MDYLDGELPEHVQACFDMHLQMCPPCVEYLKTYRATILIAKTCCHENPAYQCEKVPEELIQAILAARKGK